MTVNRHTSRRAPARQSSAAAKPFNEISIAHNPGATLLEPEVTMRLRKQVAALAIACATAAGGAAWGQDGPAEKERLPDEKPREVEVTVEVPEPMLMPRPTPLA